MNLKAKGANYQRVTVIQVNTLLGNVTERIDIILQTKLLKFCLEIGVHFPQYNRLLNKNPFF